MRIKPFAIVFGLLQTLILNVAGQAPYSKDAIKQVMDSELHRRQAEMRPHADSVWKEKSFWLGSHKIRFDYLLFGDKPASGRRMFISLHGGGNVEASANDQQWHNQMRLYKPAEGLYVVPRAPEDAWDMWHQEIVDSLLDALIETASLSEDVDLNKVYVMGYSAGGDGVYRLAPRMADYWAAASMMAGHPGDASPINLRSVPMALFVGGLDSAYNRNNLAPLWSKMLDSLQQGEKPLNGDDHPYVHQLHVYPELAHWMNRNDTVSLRWMSAFTRNTNVPKVCWQQEKVGRDRMYWLGVPSSETAMGKKVVATIHGNSVDISRNDYDTLFIYLNDKLVNLDKRVKITASGKTLFKGKLRRNPDVVRECVNKRMVPDLLYSAKISITGASVHAY